MKRRRYDTTRTLARRGSRPQPNEKPYLICVSGEHAGRLFPLADTTEISVGRTEDCEIRIRLDDMVSRRHARLERDEEGTYTLHDLESLNGTRVNGRAVEGTFLRRGDWVEVGEYTSFKFDYLSDEERAHWEAGSIDGLTDCWNRKYFDEQFPKYFTRAANREEPLSLVMVDIDHFKSINDRLGHPGGDHVLRETALTLSRWLRDHGHEALVCRYGGEEFALLLPACPSSVMREVAEGLRLALADARPRFAGRSLQMTASLGGATLVPERFEDHAEMLARADDNLYRAKREGRNRAVC